VSERADNIEAARKELSRRIRDKYAGLGPREIGNPELLLDDRLNDPLAVGLEDLRATLEVFIPSLLKTRRYAAAERHLLDACGFLRCCGLVSKADVKRLVPAST